MSDQKDQDQNGEKIAEENQAKSIEDNLSEHNPELWDFPCQFLFKAMAHAHPGVEDEIVAAIQSHIPGEYSPKVTPSRKGNYVAVSVTFTAISKEQLDDVYISVNRIEKVKFCL